ncbi:hypothetical protein [Sphingobacterium bambusae]|uniref:Uncharacterized protein n=1 Tax=Sphingobacterium bambusae TaxID=662858 RepID=A0ABW6BMM9_9SPHI|nr:hypothetical protein [Sphingobacterium bambusae]WPL47938.1 hypothetical protein SCB77_18475 [Sphingobacterium bambusae]
MNRMENIRLKLAELNHKYEAFLQGEGKWIGGGFENVITFRKNEEGKDEELQLKTQIINMLPKQLRNEIEEIVVRNA